MPRRKSVSYFLIALFFFSSFVTWTAISGFAQDQHTAKLIEAAKKEGELMWYTSMGLSDSKPMIDEFEKLYPFIKVKLYRTGAVGVLNKILAEARGGRQVFDVAESSSEMVPALMKYGLIASYPSPEGTYFDSDLKDAKGYWIATRVNPWMLGYNTKSVKPEDVPKDYKSLLLPKWRNGKISLDTEAFPLVQGLIRAWGREKALDYLRQLAAQKPLVTRGNNQRVALLAAGEMPLALAYAFTLERYKSKQGAPVDWVPLEPVPVETYVAVLASKAEHPNAAKLFINFILSRKGQEMLRDFYRVPTRNDVEPNPARLFRGYSKVIIGPDEQKDLTEMADLYREIFGIGK